MFLLRPVFQANFRYKVPENTTFSDIACGVFEGLLKYPTLTEANPSHGDETNAGSELHVSVRCACLDNFTRSKGVKYLVTYPLIEGDRLETLSMKFGISFEDLCAVNNLKLDPTIYPEPTVLVPLSSAVPAIRFNIQNSPPPTVFLPTIPREKHQKPQNLEIFILQDLLMGFFW